MPPEAASPRPKKSIQDILAKIASSTDIDKLLGSLIKPRYVQAILVRLKALSALDDSRTDILARKKIACLCDIALKNENIENQLQALALIEDLNDHELYIQLYLDPNNLAKLLKLRFERANQEDSAQAIQELSSFIHTLFRILNLNVHNQEKFDLILQAFFEIYQDIDLAYKLQLNDLILEVAVPQLEIRAEMAQGKDDEASIKQRVSETSLRLYDLIVKSCIECKFPVPKLSSAELICTYVASILDEYQKAERLAHQIKLFNIINMFIVDLFSSSRVHLKGLVIDLMIELFPEVVTSPEHIETVDALLASFNFISRCNSSALEMLFANSTIGRYIEDHKGSNTDAGDLSANHTYAVFNDEYDGRINKKNTEARELKPPTSLPAASSYPPRDHSPPRPQGIPPSSFRASAL